MKLAAAARAVAGGARLSRAQAREVFAGALRADLDQEALAALLLALARRGETADEIAGAAEALRSLMVPFAHDCPGAVDTCGTGGDGLGLFNLSSAAALVAAAAGARVIKHGNRSVSSRCGSADLFEACGVVLELAPAAARRVFEEVGICFLYAPSYHPAMRYAAPLRKRLGVRTIFNFLGPLCNPGGVRRHLLGVSEEQRVPDFAAALAELGFARAYVVHGAGGADELTLHGGNQAVAVGSAPAQVFSAAELGLSSAPLAALAGGDAPRNAQLLAGVLDGAAGPLRDAVLLNAAAALVAAGACDSAGEGCERARAALDSGAARRKLHDWAAATRRAASESGKALHP